MLAGGRSSEHAISLASARSVIDALDPARYDVLPVLIDERGSWELVDGGGGLLEAPASGDRAGSTALVPGRGARALETRSEVGISFGEVDVVFPVLHGPFGEDGTVQGLLETVGLPYVGAGVLGSAVSMDKDVCKAVLRDAGIATARSITLRDHACDPDDPAVAARIGAELGWPVFVKPATLGSSVGISKVAGPQDLAAALALSFEHDPKTLVEEHVGGRELECGVLGNERAEASAVGEILPGGDWYDFAAKYDEGGSEIVIPAPLDAATTAEVQRMALAAFCRLRVRRHGPCRLLPAPGRRAAAERGQHHPGLHRHVRVRAPVRRDRRVVPAPGRPPRRARARAPRRAQPLPVLEARLFRSSPPLRRTCRSAALPRSWPSIHPGRPRAA